MAGSFRSDRWRQRAVAARRAPRRRSAGASARTRAGRAAAGRRCRAAVVALRDQAVGVDQVGGARRRAPAGAMRSSFSGSAPAASQRRRARVSPPVAKSSAVKPAPSSRSSQPARAVAHAAPAHRRPARPAPCAPAKASASGVLSGESVQRRRHRQAPAVDQRAGERHASRDSSSTASRNSRLISLFGVMKSVARVELRMFSSAAYSRSLGIAVEQRVGRLAAAAPRRASRPGCRRPARRSWRRARRTATRGAPRRRRTARGRGGSAPCAGTGRCRRWPIRARTCVRHRRCAEQRLHARDDALGLLLLVRVGVPAELEVDAPDVVGLPVQQHALARVERRVEPEPALGRHVVLHLARRRSGSGRGRCGPCFPGRAAGARLSARRRRRRRSRRQACRGRRGSRPSACTRSACCVDADHLVLPAQVDQRQLAPRARPGSPRRSTAAG